MLLREELFHPIVSHFPIAMYFLAWGVSLVLLFFKTDSPKRNYLNGLVSFLLYVGAPFLLLSIFLGDMAFEITKKNLCSISKAYEHESYAEYSLVALIIAILVHSILQYPDLKAKIVPRLRSILLALVLSVGVAYLGWTAHLGGQLVYEQGAGVARDM
ncbi:MAG: DUF2231 domain-containing protein, partial [Bdellovibrionales bacterium]